MMDDTETARLADDVDVYRTGLRAWMEQGHLDEWRGAHADTSLATLRLSAGLVARLYESGWGRFGWPAEAGGLGGSVLHLAVLFDELSRRSIPIPEQYSVLQVLGPPMVRFAPEIARDHLNAFLRGDEWWGQCFSEPEAGSDLASLRCRATPVEDGWRVSGQKMWTSHGFGAERFVLLARTGTQESRHRGLSMFLVDADTPGITVRPIALSNGREELAEVFYDDVVVPRHRLIGGEGQGWGVAMYLLQFERGLWAWLRSTVLMGRLDDLVSQVEPSSAAARRLGRVYLDLAALRARSAITVRSLAEEEPIGPEASADKILLGTGETGVLDAARDLLDDEFGIGGDAAVARWREDWWWSRTTTIYGGAAEVQRQILADKVLKLPQEVA
jgi:alkylation response protein AidB-like acyl-CoA dehydrogenase